MNRVSMPLAVGFNINPFVEGRVTDIRKVSIPLYASDGNGSATGRFIGSMGFDCPTHWKTYVYNDLFKINQSRHVFVPEFRYTYSRLLRKTRMSCTNTTQSMRWIHPRLQ